MLLLPPSSTLFPYTTLFRSQNGICHVFSSYAFTYSTVRFLLSGREPRPRVEIVSPFAEPLQLLINAPAVTDQSLERSRLPGTDRPQPVWITSGLPTIREVMA